MYYGRHLTTLLPWEDLMLSNGKALTPEDVFLCADQLVQEGKKPTIASLRERLGSGSITTIHKYLTQWKARKNQPASPTPPPSEFSALLRAVQSQIDRAVAQVLPSPSGRNPLASRTRHRSGPGRSSLWSQNGRPLKNAWLR